MFLAHFGVGFGAKSVSRQTSLGTLLLAAQFIDLLWPSFLLLGVERVAIVPGQLPPLQFEHYPYTHSLAMVAAWAFLVGGLQFLITSRGRAAVVLGILVLSHWFLDALVHRPDLPLYPGSSVLIGLGLWQSPALANALEFTLFALGLGLYMRSTRPIRRKGSWGLALLVLLLVAVQLGNVFGPPPRSVAAVAWISQAQWLIVLFGYWLDLQRVPQRQDGF